MGSLILALTVGFLLGILLMILLVAGREEEDLLERVERTESSKAASAQKPESPEERAAKQKGGMVLKRRG
jgi:hypothetical protein